MTRMQHIAATQLPAAIRGPGVAVIMFTASWCGPCKSIKAKIAQDEVRLRGAFYSLDVDESSQLAESYEIDCLPTFIIYRNGVRSDRVVGADFEQLVSALA